MRRIAAAFLLVFVLSARASAAGAPPRDAGDFSFAVISDTRSGDRLYSKFVSAIVQRKPDFVVHTGDLLATAGSRADWAHFRELSRAITVPYYLTPGNHDIDDAKSAQVWREEVAPPGGKTFYSFVRGPDLFVVLNSSDPENDNRIAGKQLEWLRRTLDPAKYRHQFVFVHEPLFLWQGATHLSESLDRYPAARDALHRLFVERGVDIVFHGHEHVYRRFAKEGVTYIVAGGGGQPLYERGTSMSFSHFMMLKVEGPRITGQAIDREGVVRDEFELEGRRRP